MQNILVYMMLFMIFLLASPSCSLFQTHICAWTAKKVMLLLGLGDTKYICASITASSVCSLILNTLNSGSPVLWVRGSQLSERSYGVAQKNLLILHCMSLSPLSHIFCQASQLDLQAHNRKTRGQTERAERILSGSNGNNSKDQTGWGHENDL